MPKLRFDDIPGLRALVSDSLGPAGPALAVTQAMINAFADVTGDHQWIHTNPTRAAAESPTGSTIAHGFLLLSLLPGMSDGNDIALTDYSRVLNYGADKLRFIAPVTAGSRVELRRRIAAADPRGTGTLLTTESELRALGADKPALVYRSLALYLP